MKRELGAFERALALTDEYSPFNVVAIVRLAGSPAAEALQRALAILQSRHPLLRAHISMTRGRRFFESEGTPAIPLAIVRRTDDEHWVRLVEDELNRHIDASTGPLVRCCYLFDETNSAKSEIILTFPHVVVDGASGTNLCHELLSLCAVADAGEVPAGYGPLPLLPAAEESFPAAFQGWGRRSRTILFLLRQMADELGYRWRSRGTGKASPVASARCRAFTMRFSREMTSALVRQTRIRRVTLVSALNAAMLLAVSRHLYGGRDLPMRYFAFPSLRPYLKPPIPVEHLAAVITMMRFTTRVRHNHDFWSLARTINNQTYASYKRGDKFLFPLMSPHIMRALIKTKWYRMGTTALVYTGVPRIDAAYGPLRVTAFHAFVSNHDFGPEYTAQTRILGGELFWDIVYMDFDMDSVRANQIAQQMRDILLAAGSDEPLSDENEVEQR